MEAFDLPTHRRGGDCRRVVGESVIRAGELGDSGIRCVVAAPRRPSQVVGGDPRLNSTGHWEQRRSLTTAA